MTFPILLAHGVCRFDIFPKNLLDLDNNDDPRLDRMHYFKGIRTMLLRKGFTVYHSSVSWAANVDTRAEELRKNILRVLENEQAEKINIIAHSMGGLDARHMLFNDRSNRKIHTRTASLTTISTPHEGSPFADWGLNNIACLIPLARKLGVDLAALADLRTDTCKAFNQQPEVYAFETSCSKEIVFQTYAGRKTSWSVLNVLKVPFSIIEKEEGENDGLVSVASARWRDEYFKGILEDTDHLNEVGWWDPGRHWKAEGPDQLLSRIHDFYAGIAEGLP